MSYFFSLANSSTFVVQQNIQTSQRAVILITICLLILIHPTTRVLSDSDEDEETAAAFSRPLSCLAVS